MNIVCLCTSQEATEADDEHDTVPLVPLATIDSKAVKRVTVAPCGIIDSQWMDRILETGLQEQLVKQPLHNEEDILSIVRYQGWGETWNELKKDHDKHTSVSKKYIDLIRCRARNGTRDNIIGGCREGMHRCLGFGQAALRSVFNADTGIFSPETLNLAEFKKYLPVPENATDDELQSRMNEVMQRSSGFMFDEFAMKVSWVVTRDHSASKVMTAMTATSRAIYDSKKLVASESPGAAIGKFGAALIRSVAEAEEAFCDLPKLGKCGKVPQYVRKSKKEVAREVDASIADGGDPRNLYSSISLLNDFRFQQYVMDPTSNQKLENVRKVLSFPTKLHNKTVKAPLPVSYETMAQEPIDESKSTATMTSESINNLLMVPFATGILYAAQQGETPRIACRHQANRDLVSYILTFHLLGRSGFSENNSIHGALESIYGITSAHKENVSKAHGGFIAAVMLVCHVLTALIVDACDEPTVNGKKEALEQAAVVFEQMFKAMDAGTRGVRVSALTCFLGKCREAKIFIDYISRN